MASLVNKPSVIEVVTPVPPPPSLSSQQSNQSGLLAIHSVARPGAIPHTDAEAAAHAREPERNDGSLIASSMQHSRKPVRALSRLEEYFLNTWTLEWLALGFSAACLSAIYTISAMFDGQALAEWHSYLSVNTLLSMLGTGMKGSVMLATAAALGQMKWVWFNHQDRPFKVFGVYDEASRGPWGSINLLYHLSWNHFAYLGCIVTILALFSDAFIQASVVTLERSKELPGIASIPVSTIRGLDPSWDGSIWSNLAWVPFTLDDRLQIAAYTALTARPYAAELVAITPTCPTGNCTYPPVSSLGMCSKCTRRTSDIIFERLGEGIPSTLLSTYTSVDHMNLTLSATRAPPDSEAGHQHYGLLNSTFALPTFDSRDTTALPLGVLDVLINRSIIPGPRVPLNYSAYRCEMSICSRTQQFRVSRGELQIVASDPPTLKGRWERTVRNDSIFAFDLSQAAIQELDREILAQFLQGTLSGDAIEYIIIDGGYSYVYSSDMIAGIALPYRSVINGTNDDEGSKLQSIDIVGTFDEFAMTMSRAMQSSASVLVNGTAIGTESYIHIRWAYLALPALVVVLATIFVALTVWQSKQRNVPTWKESVLASVVCANKAVEEEALAERTLSGLEKWAEERVVSLLPMK